jgi:hypothetical protein
VTPFSSNPPLFEPAQVFSNLFHAVQLIFSFIHLPRALAIPAA